MSKEIYRFFVDCFGCKARFIIDGIDEPTENVEVEPSICPFCGGDNLNFTSVKRSDIYGE